MDPAEQGRSGQIFEYGRDIYGPVRYVAQSVLEMLTEVVEALRGDNYDDEDEDESDYLRTYVDFVGGDTYYEEVFYDFGDRDLGTAVSGLDSRPFIQRLYVNDAGDLDLAALAPLRNLRELKVNRAKSVLPRLAGQESLESLSIEAERVDLDLLAGQTTVWSVELKGVRGPVDVAPLATLPALIRLDVSGLDVVDIERISDFPGLRVLTLDWNQWQRLRASGQLPPRLAAVRLAGHAALSAAVDWAAWLSGARGGRQPRLETLTGSID